MLYHLPVLLQQSVDALHISPHGIYVDATFGAGGHAREILARLSPQGKLFAFDHDADAQHNLPPDPRLTFVHANFRYLRNCLRFLGITHIDGLLADLGVSSHHFDHPPRGFSFRFPDQPLDMRMNQLSDLSAAHLLLYASQERLSHIFAQYGELPLPHRLAAAICSSRTNVPPPSSSCHSCEGRNLSIVNVPFTAGAFLDILHSVYPPSRFKGKEKKLAAQACQALRIAVNDELSALRDLLTQAPALIRPGGSLVILSYHSLEDRLVKRFLKSGSFDDAPPQDLFGASPTPPFRPLFHKPLAPAPHELADNPRARSARLRAAIRTNSHEL
jgi:16S rRNA (cytosine1402-N4)-methyltransferase